MMSFWHKGSLTALVAAFWVGSAFAQSASSRPAASAVPVGSALGSAASASASASQELPPGHPPVGSSEGSSMGGSKQSNRAVDDASIPAGTVWLQVQNAQASTVPQADITLHVLRQVGASQEPAGQKTARTDANGEARFTDLQTGAEWRYVVEAQHDNLPFVSEMFALGPQAGKRVGIHVFDATDDIDQALVGVEAYVLLEPRDEVVQVEQLLRFANLSQKAWRIPNWLVPLPKGFRAFSPTESPMATAQTDAVEDKGYRMKGYVNPGVSDLVFRYQVPYERAEQVGITLQLPARVALLQVLMAAGSGMQLQVQGLPPAAMRRGDGGQRMLVTMREVMPGAAQIESASITITGVPAPGPGRWIAAGLGAAAVAAGLAWAVRIKRHSRPSTAPSSEHLQGAKQRLLEEVAALEQAHQSGQVGPKTYEHARQTLVDELARLLLLEQAVRH